MKVIAPIMIIILMLTAWEFSFLWCCIRSIMKKTLNRPPSKRKWARLYADVMTSEYEGSDSDIEAGMISRCRLKYTVRYYYDGQSYTGKIDGFTVKRGRAVIYCKKKAPEVIKEFIPVPPLKASAIISVIFIVSFMVVCEILLFSHALLPQLLELF